MLITSQITFEAFKENFVEILYQSTIERVAGEDNKDDEKNDQCLDQNEQCLEQNVDEDETDEESDSETDSNDDDGDEDDIIEENLIDEDKDVDVYEDRQNGNN